MIRERFASGIKWTTLTTISSILIQAGQMAILARLLDPPVFGIVALALVVIDFCYMFFELGISNAIIYKEDITGNQLNTLFWLNVICGVSVFFLIYACAPLISNFYKEEDLTIVIRLVGLSFLVRPFEVQFLALLRKNFQFKSIAKRQLASIGISFFFGVISALLGLEVYSLVLLYLSNVVVSAVLIYSCGLKFHKPSFHFNLKEVKFFLKFGFYLTADSIISFFNRQVDAILIGRLLPIGVLGGYNLAKNFSAKPYLLINPIINQVSFPVMSGIQNDLFSVKKVYLKSISYLSSINFPVYSFLLIYSSQIIAVVFGDKWLFIVPVFRILTITFAIRSIFNPMGALIMSRGLPRVSFMWNLVQFFLIPIAMFFAVDYGVEMVASTHLAILVILFWPAWKFIINPLSGISFAEYVNALVKPAISTIALCIILCLILLIPFSIPFVHLFLGLFVFLISYMPLNKRFNPDMYYELWSQFNNMKQFRFIFQAPVVKFILKL